MLQPLQSLEEFRKLQEEEFPGLSDSDQKRYERLHKEFHLENLLQIDQETLDKHLKRFYSGNCGRPAESQKQIFYSLYCYTCSDYQSLTRWVRDLKEDPVHRLPAGLSPEDKVPSAGSHYNFMKPLAGSPEEDIHVLPEGKNIRPEKPLSGEKAEDPTPGKSTEEPAPDAWEGIDNSDPSSRMLREFFFEIGVMPSVEAGLIPGENPAVSGDGRMLPVHASSRGHRSESLPEGRRYYSSPCAATGRDSSKKQYIYGFSVYLLSCTGPEYKKDLPPDFEINGANPHDSTACLALLPSGLRIWEKNLSVSAFTPDSAHDNTVTCNWLYDQEIAGVIDLNKRSQKKPVEIGGYRISEEGVPYCREGI